MAGQEDDRPGLARLGEPALQRQSVQAWQGHVEQQAPGRLRVVAREKGLARVERLHAQAGRAEQP